MTDSERPPKCLRCAWCIGYSGKTNEFGCSHPDDPHVADVTKCRWFEERG